MASTLTSHRTGNRLAARFRAVRETTEALVRPLAPEDTVVQSMPDVSPTKWHLAHTTWFFETFLLKPFLEGYATPEPRYEVLFNSYYNQLGRQFPRSQRGLLSREWLLMAIPPPRAISLPAIQCCWLPVICSV